MVNGFFELTTEGKMQICGGRIALSDILVLPVIIITAFAGYNIGLLSGYSLEEYVYSKYKNRNMKL